MIFSKKTFTSNDTDICWFFWKFGSFWSKFFSQIGVQIFHVTTTQCSVFWFSCHYLGISWISLQFLPKFWNFRVIIKFLPRSSLLFLPRNPWIFFLARRVKDLGFLGKSKNVNYVQTLSNICSKSFFWQILSKIGWNIQTIHISNYILK